MPGSLVASHRTFPPAGPLRVEHTLVMHHVVFCPMAVSPFFFARYQPGGLGHPRGYTARSSFPHLWVIPHSKPHVCTVGESMRQTVAATPGVAHRGLANPLM